MQANYVALLTMRKNYDDYVQARIGSLTEAKEAYDELKTAFEGKTITEFYTLLSSILDIPYDDRKTTIDEHITKYERTWNTFVGIISRYDTTGDDGFGEALKLLAKSGKAKAEFLLRSLPSFYSNTVENIRAKDYTYDDVVRKLREFIPL